jgi:O-antigen ligase
LPSHKRGILLWLATWWAWMIIVFLAFLPFFEHGTAENFYKNTILYILIPMPVIVFLPKQLDRVIYFAWAYLFAAVIGGIFAIMMLNVPLHSLINDPTSIVHISFALGIENYHWFAYQYAISLILIFSLFVYYNNLMTRVGLILLVLSCVYFLMLSSSRQSIFGLMIALLFSFMWVLFSGRNKYRYWIAVIVVVVGISAFRLIEQEPAILRIGFSSGGTFLSQITMIQEILIKRSQLTWEQGFALVPDSPIWGLGFSKHYISHNIFLGTIVDQGMIGLVFLIGFLYFWTGEAVRAWRTPKQYDVYTWKLAMVSIMVFVLVQSQFSGNPLSEWAMWWSTAFLWCMNDRGFNGKDQEQNFLSAERQLRQIR